MSKNSSRKGRPLKASSEKLTRVTKVNLTPTDYDRVMEDYDATIYPDKTAYLRARVVDKKIQKKVVNANLEQLEMTLIGSNEELNRIGVNINQIARHLNTYKNAAYRNEILALLKVFIDAQKLMGEMHKTLHQIHLKW